MSHAIALIPSDADESFLVEGIRRFNGLERGAEMVQTLSRALQGFYLAELRKLHGNSNRGNPALRNSPKPLENWADYVKKTFGFSDETARLRMLVWEGARARMAKLPPAEQKRAVALLSSPLGQMTPSERTLLENVTHKVIGHDTAVQLIAEAQSVRRPHAIESSRDRSQDADAVPSMEVPIAQQIDEQLELFAKTFLELEKTVKIGNEDVLLISRWPARKLDEAIAIKKRELTLLVKTRKAVKP